MPRDLIFNLWIGITGKMINNAIVLLLLSMLLLMFSPVLGAGMHLPGIGCRAIAMGGAFRAIADDPTAIFWNPAAISNVDGTQIILNGQFIYNDFNFTAHETLLAMTHAIREDERKLLDNTFLLGHLFSTFPIRGLDNFKFGLGLYTPLGVSSRWNILKDSDLDYIIGVNAHDVNPFMPDSIYELTVSEQLPEDDYVGQIATFTLSPAVSYDISEKIAIGAAALISHSEFSLEMPCLDSVRMDADTGFIFQNIEMNGMSFGFNIGALIKPIDAVSIGFNAKWETPYSYSGEYRERVYKFYNEYLNQLSSIIGDTMLSGGLLEREGIGAVLEMPSPVRAGIGIAYDPTDNLTLSIDLSYTHWSVIDTFTAKSDDCDSILEQLTAGWKNSFRISGGIEYRISHYALRAGFFYEPHPAVPEYQNLFIPDFNDNIAISAGTGMQIGKFNIELAGECEYFGDITVQDNWQDDILTNIPGIYSGYVLDLAMSVRYRF